MKTTPPPNFNDEKMAGLNLCGDLSLILGGGGGGGGLTNFSFYFVQDCRCIVCVVSFIVFVLQSQTISGKLSTTSPNKMLKMPHNDS